MAVSEAQKNANKRQRSKLYEIRVYRPIEEKETLKAYAASKGMSLNAYINSLIDADMKANP